MASCPALAAGAGAARSRKRSAAEAELGDDDKMDPRLEARIARYAAGSQSRRSVLIGRRSKNARPGRPNDADLDQSLDDAPAASPPVMRPAAAAAPWVDLTEDDESPNLRAAASLPARAAAQPSRGHTAVEVLSSGSDDDTPLAEIGTRRGRGGRRRDLSWMAPRRAEAGATREGRGDGARRRRQRNDQTNRHGNRARNAGSSGDVSAAGASGGQPDMDADAQLARQLQQQEDEQARRMYQQHHRQQWQRERQSLRAELEDLQDEEEHYRQRQGFAETWAARMAGVAASLGLGDNFRNFAAGHSGPPGPGRGMGAAVASLQHRELTEEDYEELSRLDEGSAGASKDLINSIIKTKLKNDHDDDCCICMDQMKKNTLVRILPCTHTFHARCADKWLKQKNSCPMCQRPIDASE
eukprot:COSAG02_NODE_1258_length_13569_cov_5.275650_4_plen_412_part_00